MPPEDSFLYITCQIGVEKVLKKEIAQLGPGFRFAYSRPGFLTFKIPSGIPLTPDYEIPSVFARTSGIVLGKVRGETREELAQNVWRLVEEKGASLPLEHLHVWQRDLTEPGRKGFEPTVTPLAVEIEKLLHDLRPPDKFQRLAMGNAQVPAKPGETVLDCILVDEKEWWVGYHRSRRESSGMAGGLYNIPMPAHAVSRAYVKMEEALRWSGLPIKRGDLCAEIGCAPGGASQALLDHGLKVMGIDPSEIDRQVADHPRFTHYRKRGSEVRRREFRKVQWLAADMNVAPNYTLDTVEAIVTHPQVNVRGLLLTLKMITWDLADHIPEYLERIRSWGFESVRATQLPHNRQEICVTAGRSPGSKPKINPLAHLTGKKRAAVDEMPKEIDEQSRITDRKPKAHEATDKKNPSVGKKTRVKKKKKKE